MVKRFLQLQKWGKRQGVSCFRVYDKDIPNFPVVIDWYDGDVCVWVHPRTRDDTDAKLEEYYLDVKESVLDAFGITEDRLYLKKRQKQKGIQTQYTKLSRLHKTKVITENALKFEVNLSDYLDTGLFLDHRNTRRQCLEWAEGTAFLNLFAYTGSFTCYALAGGARTATTVDMNPSYIEWAKRNAILNQFKEDASNRFIVENCFTFLENEAGRRTYDLIVCDPPTFSNSKKMKSAFSVDEDYIDLLLACLKLLSVGGKLIFSNNSRKFKMDETQFPKHISIKNITHYTIPQDFKQTKIHQCWVFEKS